MATPVLNIAQEWKGFTSDRRRELLAKMSPAQKKNLRASLEGAQPSSGATIPGSATIGPDTTPMPHPKPTVAELYGPGIGGYVEDARQHVANLLDKNAPSILGTLGGAVTGGAGFVPALAGAALGGFVGGKAQGKTNEQAGVDAAKQAGYETVGRVGGRVIAKALTPVAARFAPGMMGGAEGASKKAVDYLTAAAGPDAHKTIAATIGDIEKGMQSLPSGKRTVGTFLDAVNSAKDSMNEEYGNALGPIANEHVMPQKVVDRLEFLITPNMDKTAAGRAEKAAIKRAATEFQKPWTLGELDAERMTTRARLNSFHAKESVAQYAAQKASRSLAIDNAIEQGLKDTVYPAADKAAGKPVGYFSDLKGRQSNLIQLESLLNKRIEDLSGKTSQAAGSPRLSTENLSLSFHPGSTPRVGVYSIRNALFGRDLEKSAGKRVAKAFIPPEISSLPYQTLFGAAARTVGYKHTAKNAQGHTIGSNDGQNWFDVNTGTPVNGH